MEFLGIYPVATIVTVRKRGNDLSLIVVAAGSLSFLKSVLLTGTLELGVLKG